MRSLKQAILGSFCGMILISSCSDRKEGHTSVVKANNFDEQTTPMDPSIMQSLKGLYKVADVEITQNGQLIDSRGLNFVSIGFAPLGGNIMLNIRTRGVPGNSPNDGDLNGLFTLIDVRGQQCFNCYPRIYHLKSGNRKAVIREISPTTISFGFDDTNLQRTFLLDR